LTERHPQNRLIKSCNSLPNPTSAIVTVEIKGACFRKIEMYTSLGQLELYTINTISLQNLATGNYFLKIYTSGGTSTKKIIKL
jgi:hypothetical protein